MSFKQHLLDISNEETRKQEALLDEQTFERTVAEMERVQSTITDRVLKLPLQQRMEQVARECRKRCVLFTLDEAGEDRSYWSDDTILQYVVFSLTHTLDVLAHRFDGVNFEVEGNVVVAWWGVSSYEE